MTTLALVVIVLVAAPAAPPPSPPSPKAAARASMQSTLPPAKPAPKRGERAWIPSTYSLSRDPGFTPWSSFLTLHDGRIGKWTMEGTSTGGGLRCTDSTHHGCTPFAEAIAAFVWAPGDSPLGFYGGLSVASVGSGGTMRTTAGPSFGIRIRPPSLASLVRRARR
ncbi:MAG TPA: hypothetical protein VG755_07310 [Nannocystaceae bacterium]|nr:hypothetical protein [Nannocystaceae bacterium]